MEQRAIHQSKIVYCCVLNGGTEAVQGIGRNQMPVEVKKHIFWPIDGAMACDVVVLLQLLELNTGRFFAMFNDEILEMERWNWSCKTLHQPPL